MVANWVLAGTFILGLSFGSFFTLIVHSLPQTQETRRMGAGAYLVCSRRSLCGQVPVVNEMYGQRHFGVIMGSQLASQAIASGLSATLIPSLYKEASAGRPVCYGAKCFYHSFVALAGLNTVGLGASVWLALRNRSSLPIDRLEG